MKVYIAIVVAQEGSPFVQSLHVAADSYRTAAAMVLRKVRQWRDVGEFQIAIKKMSDEESIGLRPGVLEASCPLMLTSDSSNRFSQDAGIVG